jgi:hypothetical protein
MLVPMTTTIHYYCRLEMQDPKEQGGHAIRLGIREAGLFLGLSAW